MSLHTGKIKKDAVGLPAIISSFRHAIRSGGLKRGLIALKHVNQKGGFDCPSCAWPDPDDERSGTAEYCENGAKAIAEEITTKKLTADFFAQHSTDELAALTDFEIGSKGRIAEPMFLPRGARNYIPISWADAFQKIGETL